MDLYSSCLADAVTQLQQQRVTQKSAIDIFMQRLEENNLNLTELKPFLECQESVEVIACAGSGKTTSLMLRILYDYLKGNYVIDDVVYDKNGQAIPIKRNARILVATFLKAGATEMKQRFVDWSNKLGITGIDMSNISFTTLHAELYSALKAMGLQGNIWENTGDVVRYTMQHFNIRNRVAKNGKNITIEEVSDVQSIFTYYRNWLDETRYKHPLMEDYGLTAADLDTAVKWYIDYITLHNSFDFETLEELLYKYMQENPHVYDFLSKRYDFVYVDEFQDISQLQYAVLRPYFDGAKRTIVIGDDDQTIYTWRGSDINIIVNQFIKDYQPKLLNLSVNYRCGNGVLDAVIPSIECNKQRIKKHLSAYNVGGEVIIDTKSATNPKAFLDALYADIAQQNTIAIISRTNADLLVPVILLELFTTVPFIVSKNVSIGTKIPRMIFNITDLLTKGWIVEDDYSLHLLKGFFNYKATKELALLDNIFRTNPSITLLNISLEDCHYSVPLLYNFISDLQEAYGDGGEVGLRNAYKFMLRYYIQHVFVKENSFHIKARELAKFIIMLLSNDDFLGNKDFATIEHLFNVELAERLLARTKYKNTTIKATCTLTTVHECKGREWDSVYIWNDNNGTFPVKLANNADAENMEEERRLHYIAWTRARKKLTVITDIKNISPFLLECDLHKVNAKNVEVLDPLTTQNGNVLRVHETHSVNYSDDYKVAVTKESFLKVFKEILEGESSEEKSILLDFSEKGVITDLVDFWYEYTTQKTDYEYITMGQLKQLIRYTKKVVHK